MSDLADPLRILYVDDEPINLRLIREILGVILKRPHLVATARSAEEALVLLQDTPFEVLIADHRMEAMSGAELLGQARQLSPATARMMLTAYPTDPEILAALRSGAAEAVLAKPWSAREMEGALQALLSRPRPTSA